MKRIIALIMVVIFIFILSACENGENVSCIDTSSAYIPVETESVDAATSESGTTDANKTDREPSDSTSSGTVITNTSPNKNTTDNSSVTNNTQIVSDNSSTVISDKNKEQQNISSVTNNSSIAQPTKNITYTIHYEANGGWGETPSSTHRYDEPRSLSKNGYKRAGYKFVGWDENSQSSNPKFTNLQTVKNLTQTDGKVITLYAIWEESQIAGFDECKRAISGKKEVYYHTTATDNFGVTHNDVTVFVNRDYGRGEKRYDERYTNGLFSKIKGKLYLSSDFTIDSYTNLQLIIKADGNIVFKSNFFTKYSGSQSFEVDISGANIVEIYVDDPVSPHIEAWNKGGDIIVENLLLVR